MKKHLTSIIQLLVSLGIGIGLVVWFLSQMSAAEKQQVIDDIKRANYVWVIVPPLIALLSNYFRTQRWRLLFRPLGYYPGFWNTFLGVMIMYFLNLFIPRLGEVTRCTILLRYEKIPMDKALGTVVLERLADAVCLLIVLAFLVIFEHDKYSQLSDIFKNYQAVHASDIAKYKISPIVSYGFIAIIIIGFTAFMAWQARKHGLKKMMSDLGERMVGLLRGFISIKDIKNPGEFVLLTVLIWASYLLMPYLTFKMFPETSHLGFMPATTALFFGGVAYSLTPGGLGLAPIFTQIVLGIYGITGTIAISVGWVSWSVQTIAVLVVGVISLILLAIINRGPSLKEVTLKT